jgi:hypothetical protein
MEKTLFWMDRIVSGIRTSVKEQPPKAARPTDVILGAKSIFLSDLHPWNAPFPILSSPSGNLISDREEQPEKA